MLTPEIPAAYVKGRGQIADCAGVHEIMVSECVARQATPSLFEVSGSDWLKDPSLHEEVFGPLGIVVRVADPGQMRAIANGLQGQLTCTIHMDAPDTDIARDLVSILERKAGRLLVNGFPTGVEVADAMVHGGPYPASTNFGATSVGTMSIRRWLRPVCYQNLPDGLFQSETT
jgi:2,5-dioxopentanoate dehydrogenase